MKKLVRILIFAGAAFMLLRQTPPVTAQVPRCMEGNTNGYEDTVDCNQCCSNYPTVEGASYFNVTSDPGTGFSTVHQSEPTCGSQVSTCPQGLSCSAQLGTSYSVDGDPTCCPANGDSCVNGNCCSPYQCSAADICHLTCGSRGTACQTDDDCCSNVACVGGACCDPNFLQGCGYCGHIACDGSCNDPCVGGGGCDYEEAGTTCDECGDQYDCNGNCPGGCETGGQDPCATAGCYYGCIDGEVDGRIEAECQAEDPVIISLDGSAFPLTSAANGVRFDFYSLGKPELMSWTAAGANVGWLALDINRDGRIDNGSELFSNVTPQPGKAGTHLGFKALAVWDQPNFGGNGDGWITAKDYVFSRLRVWVDSNHNGISEPGELLTMQQAGIAGISVHYLPDNWTDSYGNRFQNRAQITWSDPNHGNGKGQGSGGGRAQWAYDVVLLSATGK